MKSSVVKIGLPCALVLAMAAGFNKARAQDANDKWEVEIDVYSGLRNPVFTLTAAELADIKGRVAAAPAVAGADPNVKTIRPAILGYRGIKIRGRSADGKQVVGDIEVFRGKILSESPSGRAVGAASSRSILDDKVVGLERLLINLGTSRNAIPAEALQVIEKALK